MPFFPKTICRIINKSDCLRLGFKTGEVKHIQFEVYQSGWFSSNETVKNFDAFAYVKKPYEKGLTWHDYTDCGEKRVVPHRILFILQFFNSEGSLYSDHLSRLFETTYSQDFNNWASSLRAKRRAEDIKRTANNVS